jgi:hypothetical protein
MNVREQVAHLVGKLHEMESLLRQLLMWEDVKDQGIRPEDVSCFISRRERHDGASPADWAKFVRAAQNSRHIPFHGLRSDAWMDGLYTHVALKDGREVALWPPVWKPEYQRLDEAAKENEGGER